MRLRLPDTHHTPLRLAFRRPWPGTLRGLILWFFGISFIVIGGVQYLGTTIPEPTRTYLSFALDRHTLLGLWSFTVPAAAYGGIFVVVGLLACFSGYCHFNRDQYGYVLAAGWAAAWAFVYISGWAFYDAPIRSAGAGIPWLVFSTILMLCARIPKVVLDARAGQ